MVSILRGLVSRLYELLLGLLEPPLVLEVHRVLEVHLRQLLLLRVLREGEGVLEGAGLRRVVDRLLDEPKFGKELRALLAAPLVLPPPRCRKEAPAHESDKFDKSAER